MKKIILAVLCISTFCLIAGNVRSTSFNTAIPQPWQIYTAIPQPWQIYTAIPQPWQIYTADAQLGDV